MNSLYQKAQTVCNLLASQHKTMATAESCTGGMIGQCITAIPGSSEVYGYGFITYSNESKQQLLGVKESTLYQYGAVSAQTVCEMSEGAICATGADIAVSVSGIAGPGGGTSQKPVGLVYVGIAKKGESAKSYKLTLSGDRDSVRRQTVNAVFDLIIEQLDIN